MTNMFPSMNIQTDVWHIDDLSMPDEWIVEEFPFKTVLNPSKLGEAIAGDAVNIISESKTASPNVIIFSSQFTNLKYIAVWGDKTSKFVNHFVNASGDFDDKINYVYNKLDIKIKSGVENEYNTIVERLYDLTYKKTTESYKDEREILLSKFKLLSGKDKPGFM